LAVPRLISAVDTPFFIVIFSFPVAEKAARFVDPASAVRHNLVRKNETPISTIENSPQTAARFSKSQFHQERQSHFGQSPPRWPQTVDAGLIFAMGVEPIRSLRFPRSSRLKLGRDFIRAKTKGERVVCGCLIANWLLLAENSPTRLGVVTSRKLGNAVARSRARRLLRESFRLHQHDFKQPMDLVLIGRNSIAGKSFREVEQDFLRALGKANLLKAE
jgi:ribonuclease P protein component